MSISQIQAHPADPRLSNATLRGPNGATLRAEGVTAEQLRFLRSLDADEAAAILASPVAVDIVA